MTDNLSAALREAGHTESPTRSSASRSPDSFERRAGTTSPTRSRPATNQRPLRGHSHRPRHSRTKCSPSNSTKPSLSGTRSEGRMATKPSKTAHAQLDELRQHAAAERIKRRDLEAQLAAAELDAEQHSAAITAGYAAEDQRAVARARKGEQQAIAKAGELRHQVDGAGLRVERAQADADSFERDHARDLLAERERSARTVTLELAASVAETLRLAKVYVSERQAVDRLSPPCRGHPTPRRPRPRTCVGACAQGARAGRARHTPTGAAAPRLARAGPAPTAGPDPSPRRPAMRTPVTPAEQAELETLNADRAPSAAVEMVGEQQ